MCSLWKLYLRLDFFKEENVMNADQTVPNVSIHIICNMFTKNISRQGEQTTDKCCVWLRVNRDPCLKESCTVHLSG